MGVDLRKDPAVIEAAYNDAAGVTAEFNRNMLRVLNAAAGADFDPEAFDHHAFYERELHRIEMHLVAREPQTVAIPGAGVFTVDAGETIRTEISCKHDRESVEEMLRGAGMRLTAWETDGDGLYALLLAAPE
jgi:L-histidine N-alpha-methyltransferase